MLHDQAVLDGPVLEVFGAGQFHDAAGGGADGLFEVGGEDVPLGQVAGARDDRLRGLGQSELGERGGGREFVLYAGERGERGHHGGGPPVRRPGQDRHLFLGGQEHVEAAGLIYGQCRFEPGERVVAVGRDAVQAAYVPGEGAHAQRVGRQRLDHVPGARQHGGALT
ncbi:hypothetical protein ACFFR3_09075 [Nonomuraea salmonea]|uniref:Uncharacterized protein n=1 Tax=Nonomuraea salmonea TaxID=46181 RepID=A0ABV5NIR5_9ACTN